METLRALFLSNKLEVLAFSFFCFYMLNGCNQKKIDQVVVLSQLQQSYNANKNSFDSLEALVADTTLQESAIRQVTKKIVLKNDFGFGKLLLSAAVTSKNEIAFNVKELSYGISCGYLYIRNPIRDSFANSRLIYKKIDKNWYSYIYFN